MTVRALCRRRGRREETLSALPRLRQPMPPWRLLSHSAPDPFLNVALEEAVAVFVGTGDVPPTVRLWQNDRPTICLGRTDVRLPAIGDAVAWAGRQGYAVVPRISGGTAVLHDGTTLNVTVTVGNPGNKTDVPGAYRSLLEGTIKGLDHLGLQATFEQVPDTFCDGPYDLASRGRKFCGTAQAQRRGFVMVHGTLLVTSDAQRMCRTLAEFYRRAGAERVVDPAGVASVSDLLEGEVTRTEVRKALARGYAEWFREPTQRSDLTEPERDLAGEVVGRLRGFLDEEDEAEKAEAEEVEEG